VLKSNVGVESIRVVLMKALLAMSGSMGASTEDMNAGGKKPFEANRGKGEDAGKEDDKAA
jgi:hypothetical protein